MGVGMVKLGRTLRFNGAHSYLVSICLPKSITNDTVFEQTCFFVGRGETNATEEPADILQQMYIMPLKLLLFNKVQFIKVLNVTIYVARRQERLRGKNDCMMPLLCTTANDTSRTFCVVHYCLFYFAFSIMNAHCPFIFWNKKCDINEKLMGLLE